MRRAPHRPWSPEDDQYLRDHYAGMTCSALAFYLRRTEASVWKHANLLGLQKNNVAVFKPGNQVGAEFRFQSGNTPPNKGQRTKLRVYERIAQLFDHHDELTQADMGRLLGSPSGSISGALHQRPAGLMRIARWIKSGKNYIAIYVRGAGDDAPKPSQAAIEAAQKARQEAKLAEEMARIEPIPAPVEHLWGICIKTNDTRRAA